MSESVSNMAVCQYGYNFQPNALLFSLKDETKYDLTHTISKYMKNVQVCESYFMSYYFILIPSMRVSKIPPIRPSRYVREKL